MDRREEDTEVAPTLDLHFRQHSLTSQTNIASLLLTRPLDKTAASNKLRHTPHTVSTTIMDTTNSSNDSTSMPSIDPSLVLAHILAMPKAELELHILKTLIEKYASEMATLAEMINTNLAACDRYKADRPEYTEENHWECIGALSRFGDLTKKTEKDMDRYFQIEAWVKEWMGEVVKLEGEVQDGRVGGPVKAADQADGGGQDASEGHVAGA